MKLKTFWMIGILLFGTVFLLSGCATSVNARIPATVDAAALAAIEDEAPGKKLHDKTVDELVEGGWTYKAMQNPGLARLHFTTALQKDPSRSEAFLGLASLEENAGNYPQATLFYRKAQELVPSDSTAQVGIIRTLRFDNRLDEAATELQKALEEAPNDLAVLSEQAILHDLQGRPELADPIYRQILDAKPRQASTLNNLGVSQLLRDHYAAAIVSFAMALHLDGSSPRIKNNLAMAYALSGDAPNALRLFTETVGEAAAYNNLGYLYLMEKRLDEAETALRKALELNPRFYEKAQQNLDRIQQLRAAAR